jgi:hypothetical protein
MLDAPVPYLCGVVRENWLYAQQFVSRETIIVDLDRVSRAATVLTLIFFHGSSIHLTLSALSLSNRTQWQLAN